MAGSGIFLKRHRTAAVATASAAVIQSVIERCPITITAPAIEPMAAAVTPATKAITSGRLPYRLK